MADHKILKEKLIHKGKVFSLVNEVIYAKGKNISVDLIKHPGAVVIIPVLNNNKVVLLKQFRPAVKKYIYEFPAGTLNQNETPLSAANRELEEETGFVAKKLDKVFKVIPVPGYSTEIMHFFIAKDLIKGKLNLDKDEILKAEVIGIDKILSLAKKGKISDAKTLVGIFILKYLKEL